MGLGGISMPQLLIVLMIVLLVFGTKRMKSIGTDLGSAIRGFRGAMQGEDGRNEPTASGGAEPHRISAVAPNPEHEHEQHAQREHRQ
jgi:sec-independent protein translocase protein TatA